MLDKPVQPANCVLALAIPLTKDAFLRDLCSNDKDYGKSIARRNEGANDDYLWEEYRAVAELTIRISDEVERAGAIVCRRTGIDDLRQLFQTFDVVSLLAHWRFHNIRPDDIYDVIGLLQRVRESEGELFEFLRNTFRQSRPDLLCALSGNELELATLRKEVAEVLNTLTEPARMFYESPPQSRADDNAALEPPFRLTSVLIEGTFREYIKPQGVVELCDGLHSARAFVDSIPVNYRGIIHLLMCNSVVIGEEIKKRSKQCTVIRSEKSSTPLFKLLLYKRIIFALARKPAPYVYELNRIRKELI